MKKSTIPETKVKKPEPKIGTSDWIIWAAWSDRITFEEILKKTGKTEKEVIHHMRRNLSSSGFKLWRKRVNQKSIKHLKLFKQKREFYKLKIKRNELDY